MNNPSINAHRALFNKTRHRKVVSNIVEDSADNLGTNLVSFLFYFKFYV